ncbi:hypothetical protein CBL_03005 [Carabus blaptoides fortunei]
MNILEKWARNMNLIFPTLFTNLKAPVYITKFVGCTSIIRVSKHPKRRNRTAGLSLRFSILNEILSFQRGLVIAKKLYLILRTKYPPRRRLYLHLWRTE